MVTNNLIFFIYLGNGNILFCDSYVLYHISKNGKGKKKKKKEKKNPRSFGFNISLMM